MTKALIVDGELVWEIRGRRWKIIVERLSVGDHREEIANGRSSLGIRQDDRRSVMIGFD